MTLTQPMAPDAAASDPAAPDLVAPDLVALVGSRICHDLISPLGAIGNGVELLSLMGGRGTGAEVALISESVAAANAKIRFFRIAFGSAEPGRSLSPNEIASVLEDVGRTGRVKVGWRVAGDVPRPEAKLAFLLLQCFESAMPFGGGVEVRAERGRWRMLGVADKLRADPALWALLAGEAGGRPVTPAQVHFALAPDLARRLGRQIRAEIAETRIEVAF